MRALPTEKKAIPPQNILLKPYLQPPTLKSFDLLSSLSSLDHQQKHPMPRLQLPKVLENSYFSNSQSSISHRQAYDSFVRPDISHQKRSKISQVEQSNHFREVQGKEHGADLWKQSMVMEQVDYRSDGKGLQNTPQWENQKQSFAADTKHQLHYYVKDSGDHSQAKDSIFIAKKTKEPHQFVDQDVPQTLLLKDNPKIKYIPQPLNSTGNLQKISLIKTSKDLGFSQQFSNKQGRNNIFRPPSIDNLITSRHKYKDSIDSFPRVEQKIKDPISNYEVFYKKVQDKECQTNLIGQQLEQNLAKITEQNAQLKQNLTFLSMQVQRHKQTINRLQRYQQQAERLIQKIKQLENSLKMKNDAIKDQQQANRSLQIKLSKLQNSTTLCPSEQLSPTFNNPNSSIQWLIKSKSYSDREEINQHQKCKKQIEELQEKVFDTEQIVAKATQELRERDKQIQSLQENLSEIYNAYKILQIRSNQGENEWREAYLKLKNRQQQVNKLFEAIGKQWRAIQCVNHPKNQQFTPFSPYNSPKKTIQTSQNYFKKSPFQQNDQKIYQGRPSITKHPQKIQNSPFYFSQYNALSLDSGLSHLNKYEHIPNTSPFKSRNNKQVYTSFKKPNFNLDDQQQQRKRRMSHLPYKKEPQFSQISSQIQKLRKQISKELHSYY